jgi:hypothetical protein
VTAPPDLIPFDGDWSSYEDKIYEAFLESFVRPEIFFKGTRVSARFKPPTKGKAYCFWHLISTAPDQRNRNEGDRIPDIRRCERIRWVAWAIEQASTGAPGFCWWENQRKNERRVVIWTEENDYAVILAVRSGYYLLLTAYFGIKPHQRMSFKKERDAFQRGQND